MGRVFISYRRSDSADVTGRISSALTGRLGAGAVFKDVNSIPVGTAFADVISDALGNCDAVLAVLGSDWLTAADENGQRRIDQEGDFVRVEIETALRKDIRVIPVLVRNAEMPAADDLPDSLKALPTLHAAKVRPDPDFANDMERLVAAIKESGEWPQSFWRRYRARLALTCAALVLAIVLIPWASLFPKPPDVPRPPGPIHDASVRPGAPLSVPADLSAVSETARKMLTLAVSEYNSGVDARRTPARIYDYWRAVFPERKARSMVDQNEGWSPAFISWLLCGGIPGSSDGLNFETDSQLWNASVKARATFPLVDRIPQPGDLMCLVERNQSLLYVNQDGTIEPHDGAVTRIVHEINEDTISLIGGNVDGSVGCYTVRLDEVIPVADLPRRPIPTRPKPRSGKKEGDPVVLGLIRL